MVITPRLLLKIMLLFEMCNIVIPYMDKNRECGDIPIFTKINNLYRVYPMIEPFQSICIYIYMYKYWLPTNWSKFPTHPSHCPCAWNAGNHRLLVIPTCITARAWRPCRVACGDRSLSASFEVGGGENIPGIPGASATLNFTYLVRGPSWYPAT